MAKRLQLYAATFALLAPDSLAADLSNEIAASGEQVVAILPRHDRA